MTEDKLQFDIFTDFWKNHPEERGFLYRTENKTNKGANKRTLGLIPGCPDLHYQFNGGLALIELKVNNTYHPIEHLEKQFNFIVSHCERGSIGFFCFSKAHFYEIFHSLDNGICKQSTKLSTESLIFIKEKILMAEKAGDKTVKLNFFDNRL